MEGSFSTGRRSTGEIGRAATAAFGARSRVWPVSEPGGSGFRLYRSESDRKICGVAGGLAEVLDIDPTLVRLLWVLVVLVTSGVGLLAYLAMWAIVPVRSELPVKSGSEPERGGPAPSAAEPESEPSTAVESIAAPSPAAKKTTSGPVIAGVVLIVLGALFLLDNWVPLRFWSFFGDLMSMALRFWPLILIAVGAILLFSRLRR